jgi:hypothetical protein
LVITLLLVVPFQTSAMASPRWFAVGRITRGNFRLARPFLRSRFLRRWFSDVDAGGDSLG